MITFDDTLRMLRDRLPPSLNDITPTMQQATKDSVPDAAVALILREGPGSGEMLIIQRADNPGDYWSGHLALPGGRADRDDRSLVATAAREVEEEVGISLSTAEDFVGRLSPVSPSSGRLPSIRVTPFVAVLPRPVSLRLSHEVGAAFWTSVDGLRKSGLCETLSMSLGDRVLKWPAYPSARGPIWGLTQRIITEFLTYLD